MAVLGLLAGSLITACVLPQLAAALRASDVSGVSVTGSAYAAASCAGWALYAARLGLVEVAWSSAIGVTLWGAITVIVAVRAGRAPSSWVGLWAGSIVISPTVIGIDGLGMLLLLEAVTNTVPQALRARREAAGVSPQAFLTMGIGAACWAVYGLGAGDGPLAVSSAIKTAMCITIVKLLRPRRRPTQGRWWPRPPAAQSSSQPDPERSGNQPIPTVPVPRTVLGRVVWTPPVHGVAHLEGADGVRHRDRRLVGSCLHQQLDQVPPRRSAAEAS